MDSAKCLFRQATLLLKAYYQHLFSAALVTLSFLIIYGHDFEILVNEALQSEILSHVLLIPILVGILFYRKKDFVMASLALEKGRKKNRTQYVDEVTGIALCLVSFLIYWYGSYTFYPLEYHLLSFPIFVMGITLILFNFKTLVTLIYPILFLFFITPPPAEIIYTLGGAMANINTHASYTLLKTIGLPVKLSLSYGPPTIILTSSTGTSTTFAIDLACSGIYSLIAFAVFAAFLAFIASASLTRKTGLFVLGFLIFEALNIIRITTIVSIAHWFGEEIAMIIFHSVAGLLLIFTGMLTTLLVAEKFFKISILPKPKELQSCPKCKTGLQNFENFCTNCGKFFNSLPSKIPQRFWIKLTLLLLGCSIVTLSIHAPTFALAKETIKTTSGLEKAANIFPATLQYQDTNYTLKFLYRDTNFEKIARQDASLVYAYFPSNKSKAIVYLLIGVSNSISNLHSWEVCLISWQIAQGRLPLVTTLESRDIQLLPDTPIIARYLVFRDTRTTRNYTQVTLYWYERAAFNTGATVEQKYVRISLVILTHNSTNYQQFENQLLTVGREAASHWQPLKSQALISLGIPSQQLLLATAIGFIAFTKTTEHINNLQKKTNNQKIFNNFASPEEKLVLQTIQKLSKETKATNQTIYAALQKTTNNTIKPEKILTILSDLENYGLIKKDISKIQNQPKLIWKF